MNASNVLLFATNFLLLFYCCLSQEDVLVVKTNSGKVIGKIAENKNGGNFYSFQSIPYAKPPIGNLRFKAPEPVEPWDDILNGTKKAPWCPQTYIIRKSSMMLGQEDCLYLNIFTPILPEMNNINGTLLPVMVSIHGGGFSIGSSSMYGPEFLLTEEIVLVTFNYRLGMLGFLSFNNETLGVPGNAGMKDQVLALKWIKENIKHFGGNPNDITLFGESAGSVSVHMHILSPMSKGLFNKAIAQSGSALNLWATGKRDNGKILGDVLNITAEDDLVLLKELRKLPFKDLLKGQSVMLEGYENKKHNCCIVEEYQKNQPAFLPRAPADIIKSGDYSKVPFMLGYNSQEGMLVQLFSKMQTGNVSTIDDYAKYIPHNLPNDTKSVNELAAKFEEFYQPNETQNGDFYLQPTINFVTDSNFYYHIYETALAYSKNSKEPVYFYRFSADTKLNFLKRMVPELISYPGAAHGDDVAYLFKMFTTPQPNTIEEVCVDRVVKLWTNFAKYTDPTPKNDTLLNNQIWKRFVPNDEYILEIGNTISTSTNPDYERYKFWKNIYETYS